MIAWRMASMSPPELRSITVSAPALTDTRAARTIRLDVRGDGRVADVGIDFDAGDGADANGVEVSMIDVSRYDQATGRDSFLRTNSGSILFFFSATAFIWPVMSPTGKVNLGPDPVPICLSVCHVEPSWAPLRALTARSLALDILASTGRSGARAHSLALVDRTAGGLGKHTPSPLPPPAAVSSPWREWPRWPRRRCSRCRGCCAGTTRGAKELHEAVARRNDRSVAGRSPPGARP